MAQIQRTDRGGGLGPPDIEKYLKHYGWPVKEVWERGGATWNRLSRCVFDSSHGEGKAMIVQSPNPPYIYYQCFHESCMDKTWKDVRMKISGMDSLRRFCEGGGEEADSLKILTPWEQFLDKALGGDRGASHWLQDFLGSCLALEIEAPGLILTGDKYSRALVIGAFRDFLSEFLEGSVLDCPFSDSDLNSYLALGFLPGKLLVDIHVVNWSLDYFYPNIESMVDGDAMEIEREYGNLISFTPSFRVLISSDQEATADRVGDLLRRCKVLNLLPTGVRRDISFEMRDIRLWAHTGLIRFLERGGLSRQP